LKDPVEIAVNPCVHSGHIVCSAETGSKADRTDQLGSLLVQSHSTKFDRNRDPAHQAAAAVSRARILATFSTGAELLLLQGGSSLLVRLCAPDLLEDRNLKILENISWVASCGSGGTPASHFDCCAAACEGVQGVVLMVVPPGEADWLNIVVVFRFTVELEQCNVVHELPGLVVLRMVKDLLHPEILDRGATWTVHICAQFVLTQTNSADLHTSGQPGYAMGSSKHPPFPYKRSSALVAELSS